MRYKRTKEKALLRGEIMEDLISLENVSVIRDGRYIIEGINWNIKKGENWAVIGRNGSGKSFLLRILSTIIYPSEGDVTIYSNKLGQTNIWELRRRIGIVSDYLQKEYTENVLVKDVIVSGFFSSIGLYQTVTPEQIEKTALIMKKLDISHLSERPYGQLSQGEQKRVLIGRSLVFDPDLLILDEPTTGLDIASREDFLILVKKLINLGHNIILVTHYIDEIIPEITNILLMKDGKVYESGDKKEMMKKSHLNNVLGYSFNIKKKHGRYWAII